MVFSGMRHLHMARHRIEEALSVERLLQPVAAVELQKQAHALVGQRFRHDDQGQVGKFPPHLLHHAAFEQRAVACVEHKQIEIFGSTLARLSRRVVVTDYFAESYCESAESEFCMKPDAA